MRYKITVALLSLFAAHSVAIAEDELTLGYVTKMIASPESEQAREEFKKTASAFIEEYRSVYFLKLAGPDSKVPEDKKESFHWCLTKDRAIDDLYVAAAKGAPAEAKSVKLTEWLDLWYSSCLTYLE